ncbi:glycosyltransferase [Leptolyngbya sp. PCC 6406]|uniref:glycosyltransferase n=1 Tax=Leptolyngbya sp. PCC 6406 TaxID=1173264 RepID=UPI0021F1B5AC|nr:glycosyltransferase [Leptolyngbya sp. PCC 6406]
MTQRSRVPWATGIVVGSVLGICVLMVAWFVGNNPVAEFFQALALDQAYPPMWVQAPEGTVKTLLLPTVVLSGVAWGITKGSRVPRRWSRFWVVVILLALLMRYLGWRMLSTLNLSTPLNGTASLLLLGMELLGIAGSVIQLLLLLGIRDRRSQAAQLQEDVISGHYQPTVDVLIPTYDEPEFILRRTIIGCQALAYPHKTVYLLDDTRRPEIRALATELGCEYLTRPDNRHAKAGNLNHALAHTQGELIACFDADFVPTRNFLHRTLGFFQESHLALVQTPQSFYNPDPIARNLGLEGILTPDEEVFYRQIQPMRDGVGSVVCSGTSFVVRRSALERAGGFVTDSLSEDYFTAIRLAAQGDRVVYLDEKLSAGLAAETIGIQATQRIRWARGTLQAFFIDSNPLTIPGLRPLQRLGHLEGLLHWFGSIPRLVFLLMPLAYPLFGVIPIQATAAEALYFFAPYYFVQLTVFSWLNHRSRSALLSDIYSLVLVFPLAVTVVQALLRPFAQGFSVTPKGQRRDRFRFNWSLAWPLLITWGLTAVSLAIAWTTPPPLNAPPGLGLGWIWGAYNLVMIAIALFTLLDVPDPDPAVWLGLRRVVRLILSPGLGAEIPGAMAPWGQSLTIAENSPRTSWWGTTVELSEKGAKITLTQSDLPPLLPGETRPVTLVLAEESLALPGTLVAIGSGDVGMEAQIRFAPLSLPQQRQLVELLFCRPGQWQRWNSPGELRSLWLLLRIFCRPRILTRNTQVKPIPIVQG